MTWHGRAGLWRHIAACNNARLPGDRVPFRIGGEQVGWVQPEAAAALAVRDADGLALPARPAAAQSSALAAMARRLADLGLCQWRDEAFDVRAEAGGPSLATLDRGAVPLFGVIGEGVHLNGLVRRDDGLHVWVAVRARDKAIAPGLLDNIVAGGIPAGLSAEATLVKEAREEASLPADLVARARRVGRVSYVLENAEGLRRDVLHCFDLELPEGVTPLPDDGEVERFELWPAARLLAALREGDGIKFNVTLVLIDLFLRAEMLAQGESAGLRAALRQGP